MLLSIFLALFSFNKQQVRIVIDNYLRHIALLAFGLLAAYSTAKVEKTASDGFLIHIEQEWPISASRAYQGLLQIDAWWDKRHTWFGRSSTLRLDNYAGGCFCERAGNKSAVHMRVIFVHPGREIRLAGALGPLQTMGANGLMRWQFSPLTEQRTRVTLTYLVRGASWQNLAEIAQPVNHVLSAQFQSLGDYLMVDK